MGKSRRFVSFLCDARQKMVIDRLGSLELEAPIKIYLSENLLAKLERRETRLKATTVANEPTIDDFNNRRVDINKLIGQQSSIPSCPINIPDDTATSTQPT